MREFAKVEKKSNKLLSQIRKDITHLINLNDSNHKDARKLKRTIEEIHSELNGHDSAEKDDKNQTQSFESLKKHKEEKDMKLNQNLEDLGMQTQTKMDEEINSQKEELKYLEIPNKIVVKKISRRRSFSGWLFNNMDI